MSESKIVDFIYFYFSFLLLFYFLFIYLFLDLGLGVSMTSYMTITKYHIIICHIKKYRRFQNNNIMLHAL